ncbi:acyl-CoA thioesterase [Kineobactrum salinum]|uniref:Acyl-CoA thioesterase n=1 Tax=Kineobactrum salinum TaxID=2708301 RepID=A0A6C0TWQ4_9GAMM|nr:thioesterase family protein [Kineobactrum salinum]QIB64252.1 acyl-CoA thioesterase [Kineobactrum salinum]
MTTELPFTETVRVRYRDTDAQGHLYFANYLVLADETAGAYMETLGYSSMNPSLAPCFVFTVNVNCDYLGECTAFDRIKVAVGYTRLGRSSAEMTFELRREADAAILARGSLTQVFVDKVTRKSIRIPAAYREAIIQHQPELAAAGS